MAQPRFRHASMFVNGTKVAECFKSKQTLASGDERQFGDAGVVGATDGAVTLDVDFDTVVPVAGMSVNPEQMMLNHQYVDIQAGYVDGEIWECTMRFTTAEYDSDAQKGSLTGTFKLISAGIPTIT
jgi:hypothetical protein